VAAWQQLMMTVMPPLTHYAESFGGISTKHAPK